jgi:hypothetical protein
MSTDLTRVCGITPSDCSLTSGVLGDVVGEAEELWGESFEGEEIMIGYKLA